MYSATMVMKKTYLNCDLTGNRRWRHESGGPCQTLSDEAAAPRRSDLRKVVGRREDLLAGRGHVLLAAGDDEDGLLAAHRRLDVRVGLGAQRFDLATCSSRRKQINVKWMSVLTRAQPRS